LGACCILVVNDDVRLADSVQRLLLEDGYDVHVTYDGASAIQGVSQWQPDLILLDLFMPRLDGWGFLEYRAVTPALQDTPVLVWSVGSRDDLDRARQLGATECLSRVGSDPDGLLASVARLVKAPRPASRSAP
jgi:CheY-like chemotaxis protein